jgi:hypothetical protein
MSLTREQIKHHKLTPSVLPENTVIEDDYYGKYIKEADGVWVEVHAALGENPVEVHDLGDQNTKSKPTYMVDEPADTYFSEFDIVSVPVGWKLPQPPSKPPAIWKRIPKHPTYEVSSDGRVRRTGSPTSKAKAKSKTTGNYILYENGQPVKWNESMLGDEAAIKAFFERV